MCQKTVEHLDGVHHMMLEDLTDVGVEGPLLAVVQVQD